MNKRFYFLVATLAILALALSACNNPRAESAGVWYNPFSWGDQTLTQSLEVGCVGGATSTVVDNSIYPCPEPTAPAVEVKPNEADLCADQVNPAWGNLAEKNTLTQAVYETWALDVQANGGAIFGASKCSLPVDSRVFGPADEVAGSGPTQLVTDYRFNAIWHPEVDATYEVAAGCVFEPLFAQGDAPVAVYRAPGTVRLQNNVSNGVSLVGIVTCGN